MILVLGGSGLLGQQIIKTLLDQKIKFLAPSRAECDITSLGSVENFFRGKNFEKIIFCAAFTSTEQAETMPQKCLSVNLEGLKNILRFEVPIIHFSTDYVFDGSEDFYAENSRRNPLNFYGKSKLLAEKELESCAQNFWNIRTSSLYGGGKDFVSQIQTQAKKRIPFRVADDVFIRPTSAKSLAEYVVKNFVLRVPICGHYHAQSEGVPLSWYQFSQKILEGSGLQSFVLPIAAKEIKSKVRRPSRVILENTKIPEKMPNHEEDWEKFFKICI